MSPEENIEQTQGPQETVFRVPTKYKHETRELHASECFRAAGNIEASDIRFLIERFAFGAEDGAQKARTRQAWWQRKTR